MQQVEHRERARAFFRVEDRCAGLLDQDVAEVGEVDQCHKCWHCKEKGRIWKASLVSPARSFRMVALGESRECCGKTGEGAVGASRGAAERPFNGRCIVDRPLTPSI